jgi:predicted anti-sigma-YlaC factor YlaD
MSDRAYSIIGMGLTYLVAFMVAASIALGLVWLALAYWPRLHLGALTS